MIREKISRVMDHLYKENHKSFYLSFLRVAISLWFLKELLIDWPSLDILYGPKSFLVRSDSIIFQSLPGHFSVIRNHYMVFIYIYIALLLLNIAGIGRWFTALLLFIAVDILYKLNMTVINGGDMMARFILLYLIFANSYDYFVLSKTKLVNLNKKKISNLISNLAAYSIMLQLCVAYFCSAARKLPNELWRNGEAVYYALSMQRFIGTSLNQYIIKSGWLMISANYLTLAFELFFPFLIWIKQLKKPLLITGIIFHLSIYIFMMIYGFQIVFILIYGLFLSNDEVVNFAERMKKYLTHFLPKQYSAIL